MIVYRRRHLLQTWKSILPHYTTFHNHVFFICNLTLFGFGQIIKFGVFFPYPEILTRHPASCGSPYYLRVGETNKIS